MTTLTWNVVPGASIGPFVIGSGVNEVLSDIMRAGYLTEPAEITFNESHPFSAPVVISLRDIDMVLVFTPRSHRLEWVTAGTNVRHLTLSYGGHTLVAASGAVRCRDIVDIFPPTTLGQFNDEDHSYTIEFKTGVSMNFKVNEGKFLEFKLKREHPVGSSDYSPNLESITVRSIGELDDSVNALPRFEVIPREGVRVTRPGSSESSWIELGSGLQDVLSCLGPPDDTNGDLYNFFSLGVDVKVNRAKCCAVEKIVLHCNQPGHIQFGRYNRAWFDISEQSKRAKAKSRDSSCAGIDSETTLPELTERLGDPGAPLVVNNPNTTAVQYFYTFKRGLTFELTPSGSIASVEVFAQ